MDYKDIAREQAKLIIELVHELRQQGADISGDMAVNVATEIVQQSLKSADYVNQAVEGRLRAIQTGECDNATFKGKMASVLNETTGK